MQEYESPFFKHFDNFITLIMFCSSVVDANLAAFTIDWRKSKAAPWANAFEIILLAEIIIKLLASRPYKKSESGVKSTREKLGLKRKLKGEEFYNILMLIPLQFLRLHSNNERHFFLLKIFRITKLFKNFDVSLIVRNLREKIILKN